MGFHQSLNFLLISAQGTFVEQQLGEISRKAVSFPKLNDRFGRKVGAGFNLGGGVFEELQTTIEGAVKLLFLGFERGFNLLLTADELGKDVAHLLNQHRYEFVEEGMLGIETKHTTKANGTS